MIKQIKNFVKIDTANTTLLLRIDSVPEIVHYGKKLSDAEDYPFWEYGKDFPMVSSASDYCGRKCILSFSGDGNNRETMLHALSSDGNGSLRLRLKEVKTGIPKPVFCGMPSSFDCEDTVVFVYEDAAFSMVVEQYFSTFPSSDVIATGLRIKNVGTKDFYLRRAFSMQLDFDNGDYSATAFVGNWMRERKMKKTDISVGCTTFSSFLGHSSNVVNPFVLCTKEGKNGFSIASNLVYSGNHKELFDCSVHHGLRVATGINDFMLNYKVAPSASFDTPEAVFTYGDDEESVCFAMRAFAQAHILRKDWVHKPRAIAINTWETFLFQFDKAKLLELCDTAKRIGIELFVLDDGWFGHRDDDTKSLGDWFANEAKLGCTLEELAKEIHAHGLQFGIWIEPEMISEDSELYKAHPDWAMTIEGVTPLYVRNQLVLDITKKEVRDYIVDKISKVLEESQADYVKWDCNRGISELKNAGELFHDYVLGVYDLLDRLTKKHPDVLFESCASGGNRFDLGMLYYTPQIWTSDCTDARSRIFIQEGTIKGYPLSTVSAHVAFSPSHHTFNKTSLQDRFAVAIQGVLGYELNLTTRPQAELDEISLQTAFYKKWRNTLQFGDFYEGDGSSDEKFISWSVVSQDKASAITTGVCLQQDYGVKLPKIRVSGIDENATYKVSVIRKITDAPETFIAKGDLLVHGGVYVGDVYDMKTLNENSNSIASVLITMERVEA